MENTSESARTLKETQAKAAGKETKNELAQAAAKNKLRYKLIEQVSDQIKAAKLTPLELLNLLQQMGITPLHNRFQDRRTKETQIRFLEHPGPVFFLLNRLGMLCNLVNHLRNQVTKGAPLTAEHVELIVQLSAQGYVGRNGLKTPKFFEEVENLIEEKIKVVNAALKDMGQRPRERRKDLPADVKLSDGKSSGDEGPAAGGEAPKTRKTRKTATVE